ncbi:P63C domain-containing protein [Paenarthrobacter sp. NPDC089675]|uniref:P63C domain-containing protein n=1 Tax=Paenarthrobacter TaxID=1742992 RepID=UPI00380284DF
MSDDQKRSSEIASAGGEARAKALSPEERKEIAQRAAAARWGADIAHATHAGEILIGEKLLQCAVLEDGTRLINQETFLTALGRAGKAKGGTGSASSEVPPFLAANNLQPYVSDKLRSLWSPIRYSRRGTTKAYGYRAEILPEVCEVYLDARQDGVLAHNQLPAAQAAEIIVRGLARVGIVALVDEATGYQETRARHELQQILEAYVVEELRPWVKTFPDEFFRQMYRLHGWAYKPGTSKRTSYAGRLVNKYIYEQLPKVVHEEIKRKNPRNERGNRAHKHHQFLTEGTGVTALDRQISTVTTLMRIAENKHQFEDLFDKAYPPLQPKLPLFIDVEP